MIASLSGRVAAKSSGYLIIEVAGIGYQVLVTEDCSRTTNLGSEIQLWTRLIVREDALTLYGFTDETAIELFDEFLKVSGVGPRSALALLSGLAPAAIVSAIEHADEKFFLKVSGIGPKTARLIIATLQGRLQHILSTETIQPESEISEQLIDALLGLGWTQRDAEQVIERLETQGIFEQDYDLPQLLKLALVGLGNK